MRPLYLSIKGFGPYIQTEISEETFKQIHQERFFLISGEIGAGKTTLFDAIFFALFGEATFPDRTPKDLISHHLSKYPHIEPEVVFKFMFKGQIYKIIRKPPYGRRQTYITTLWINETLYSQRNEEISDKFKEIFGLEGKYFKRIFMIPQGEYRKLLLTTPSERKGLFEKLFEMEILSRLETFFKDKGKSLEQNISHKEKELKNYLNLANVTTPEELKNKLSKITSELNQLKQEHAHLTKKLTSLEKEGEILGEAIKLLKNFHQAEETLKKHRQNKPKIDLLKKDIIKLKTLRIYEYPYRNMIELKAYLKDKINLKNNYYKKLKDLKEDLNSKRTNFMELKAKEDFYEKMKESLLKKKELLKILSKKEGLERELQELIKIYEETLKAKEILEDSERELIKKRENLSLLKKIKELEETLINYEKFEKKSQDLDKLQREIKALEREREGYKREYEKREIEALICKLAEGLKEGMPCPLCGSEVHPKKASSKLLLPFLETLKENLNSLERKLEEKKDEYSRLVGEIFTFKEFLPQDKNKEELEEELKEHLKKLKFEGIAKEEVIFFSLEKRERDLEERLKNLIERKKVIEEKLEDLKEKKAQLEGQLMSFTLHFTQNYETLDPKHLNKEILYLEGELNKFEKEKGNLEETLHRLEREGSLLEGKIKGLKEEISSNLKKYKESIKELSKLFKEEVVKNFKELSNHFNELSKLEEYEREVQSYENTESYLEETLINLETKLKELKLSYKIFELEELERNYSKILQEKKEIERKREELVKNLGSLEEQLSNLEKLQENYKQVWEEKRRLEEEYSYLEKINELLSGKKSGISFHSYVLSKFLTLVLKRANLYLRDFTLGRYAFVEGEIFTRRFTLKVLDSHTGKDREVNTLSGGESFLASLAFALGTSDVVIALSKKNPLETLLIDEGFGTLDENTLEKVIKAIVQLSHKTGKIIGVISHLRELKDYFPILIEIIKEREGGSKIQIKKNL